ncbi:MAG TPA: hypothetical protein VK034_19550, partial [Enhygromyxa sp.]|nr:hypothetical protein [Enhygromyxa sp.]
MRELAWTLGLTVALAGCDRDRELASPDRATDTREPERPAEPAPPGVDELRAAIDPSADPCVDFYQY